MADDPDLRRLILDAKGDRSYDRLSADSGGNPTSKRLQQLATGEIKAFPDRDTIEGLARGLGVTITQVVLASARSLGLKVYEGNDPDALVIGGGADLNADQREALFALVRSFRASNHSAELTAARGTLDASMAVAKSYVDDPENRPGPDRLILSKKLVRQMLERLEAAAQPDELSPRERRQLELFHAWERSVAQDRNADFPLVEILTAAPIGPHMTVTFDAEDDEIDIADSEPLTDGTTPRILRRGLAVGADDELELAANEQSQPAGQSPSESS